MAETAAQICNIGLLRIGQRQLLDDLDSDRSASGKACKALFADARNAVLAELWWGFATKRATLATVANATRDGWTYVYATPLKMVAAQYVYSGTRNPAAPIAFELFEGETDGSTVLATDQAAAILSYTYQHETVIAWPPLFVDALAWRLAVELALAMQVKPQVGLAMQKSYLVALAKAQAADANQTRRDPRPDSELITGR